MKTIKILFAAATLSLGLFTATGAQAGLMAADGGQTVYDTDRNIFWLANANLAATNSFGISDFFGLSGINANGTMSWFTAQKWIRAMNTANYLGYNDWRLPTTLQPDPSCSFQIGGDTFGYNCTGSEMGHLFYNELGGTADQSILNSGDTDLSLFTNLQSNDYWSGTEYAPNTDNAWRFAFDIGLLYAFDKGDSLYALAVRPGQVSAVPEPGSALLFGIGLLGLLGVARRRLALR